jgi:hypothetical protein
MREPMLSLLRRAISSFLFGNLLLLSIPFSAYAVAPKFSALRVTTTGGGVIAMTPGEVKNISVSFQNTGSETWKNDGTGYISLYTHGPKYRKSVFDPGTWLSASQVKRLGEVSVKPNATGTVSFALKAPSSEGAYKETFALAAESLAWIPGGEFTLNITVKKTPSTTKTTTDSQQPTTVSTVEGYSASIVAQTATSLKVKAKKPVSFMAVIKNTGTKTWKNLGISSSAMSIASGSADFRHSTWSGSSVATLTQAIKPGEQGTVQFFFTAPNVSGTHTAKFQITADGIDIPDAFVQFPVEVTGGAKEAVDAPRVEESEPAVSYIEEPTIRVGVLIVDEETNDEVYVTSYESDFDLTDVDGTVLGSFSKGEKVHAAYVSGRYVYGSGDARSAKPLRFVPKTANAVMTITNFDRRKTRDTQFANNTFRNVLELRYNTKKDRTWIINELPVEYYLRGLAETSNLSHPEFQKTLLTAARTYAYYHIERSTKHAAEGYQVDAYQDQVYWGYGQEERTPLITEGVEATRGQIVTYEGQTAITPYFSRSDGHTRDWSEVWGGNVPWVKGVPVPCDVGKTLWGHGVGMSASGAICMAKEGKEWKEILKYFYTGIEITKRWK